ncbi:hypothetical protein ACXR0O_26985 [Verrucomicrobiota bacterium sgz303538]
MRRADLATAEFIAVGLLVAVVMATTVPKMIGIGKSRALAIAGEKVTRMITLARENAVGSNSPTALVLLTKRGSESGYCALAIVEAQTNGKWRQITNWEPLPEGVAVDLDRRHCTFLDKSPPLDGLDASRLGYRDRALTGAEFAYRVFLPNGALSNPDIPAQIRLVEDSSDGSRSGVASRYRPSDSKHFYDIAIVGTTGAVRAGHY